MLMTSCLDGWLISAKNKWGCQGGIQGKKMNRCAFNCLTACWFLNYFLEVLPPVQMSGGKGDYELCVDWSEEWVKMSANWNTRPKPPETSELRSRPRATLRDPNPEPSLVSQALAAAGPSRSRVGCWTSGASHACHRLCHACVTCVCIQLVKRLIVTCVCS